jgi:Holliday junction resolvase RusA-like endonuclease
MITIFVRDTPRPGGSKKSFLHNRTGKIIVVDANKHTKTWRDSVRAAAIEVYKGHPLTGPISVDYTFYFNRPNSHHGTGRNKDMVRASAPGFHTIKPDLTKLIRSTEDALTGLIWKDDSQVCRRMDEKKYVDDDEKEGVLITILPL